MLWLRGKANFNISIALENWKKMRGWRPAPCEDGKSPLLHNETRHFDLDEEIGDEQVRHSWPDFPEGDSGPNAEIALRVSAFGWRHGERNFARPE
jgi:hypothetical protein